MTIIPGVDIVYIPRFLRYTCMDYGTVFLASIFTPREQNQVILGHPEQIIASLAARFAAKEAIIKASGGSLGLDDLRKIEILKDDSGAPRVVFSGSRAAEEDYQISMSHDEDYAIAFCIRNSQDSHQK